MVAWRAALVLVGVVGLLGVGGCQPTVHVRITSVTGDRDSQRLQYVTHLCRSDVEVRGD